MAAAINSWQWIAFNNALSEFSDSGVANTEVIALAQAVSYIKETVEACELDYDDYVVVVVPKANSYEVAAQKISLVRKGPK